MIDALPLHCAAGLNRTATKGTRAANDDCLRGVPVLHVMCGYRLTAAGARAHRVRRVESDSRQAAAHLLRNLRRQGYRLQRFQAGQRRSYLAARAVETLTQQAA